MSFFLIPFELFSWIFWNLSITITSNLISAVDSLTAYWYPPRSTWWVLLVNTGLSLRLKTLIIGGIIIHCHYKVARLTFKQCPFFATALRPYVRLFFGFRFCLFFSFQFGLDRFDLLGVLLFVILFHFSFNIYNNFETSEISVYIIFVLH